MKLITKKRTGQNKGESKRLRRAGHIPAVLYSKGGEGENLSIQEAEFSKITREITKGHLSTTRITLVDEAGAERHVLVKDIQYHPTTYNVQHVDFIELRKGVPVSARVPIELTGRAKCKGVKAGGFLRQIVRGVQVNCLPEDLPDFFELDVEDLGMKQSVKMNKIEFPEKVTPKIRLETVVATVAKR